MTIDNKEKFRVSIIGGGLGGLALAQMLKSNPRLQVVVYERSSTDKDPLTGYRIQMEAQALEGLKAHTSAEVAAGIEASIGYQPVGGQLLGFMDARRKKMLASWYPPAMRTMKSVNRWLLRDALIIDTGSVLELGKRFSHYKEVEDGPVRLFFTDGTHEECDLLVGADGVRSMVRQQLLPNIKVRESGIGVTYFKVPYTSETQGLLPFGTGVAAFCGNNQVITIHSWVNPKQKWAVQCSPDVLDPDQSFIMLGLGSEVCRYKEQARHPEALTPPELREEVRRRISEQRVDPIFTELIDRVIVNSAYSNVLKLSDTPARWNNDRVTLIGDSIMNMSPYTGKGASLAFADAMALAKVLETETFFTCPETKTKLMSAYVEDMLRRRKKQRKGGVFIQRVVFSGKNVVKVAARDNFLRCYNVLGHGIEGFQKPFASSKIAT
ncbi:hypothetical protein KCU95_g11529, partial [Aureobasidium melanogenum]